MTEKIDILVPQEVVNDTSVRVIRLSLQTGLPVLAGQRVVDLETSKSILEIDAPSAGWVQVLCKVGDDLPVGSVLGHVFATEEDLLTALKPKETKVLDEIRSPAIFSRQALEMIVANGLDPEGFGERAFVRKRDVLLRLGNQQPEGGETSGTQENITFENHQISSSADSTSAQVLDDGWSLAELVCSDLHRINGRHDWREFLRQWWWNPAFKYVLWFRIAQFARKHVVTKWLIYYVAVFFLHRCHLRTGIRIPLSVRVGPGLNIGHWGSIWINPACSIGANCTIGTDISVGSAGGAGEKGVPQIGNNVFIGPGSRLAGPISIGNNVAIMPNSLVTADVPEGGVVLGVPHRISRRQITNPFVSNTDY